MSEFRFQRFSIINERSAMKVNTDGVLLGACVPLTSDTKTILDAGTGTGTIALMIAQRLSDIGADGWSVTGIDIDLPSAEEASMNFARSPWSMRLNARLMPLLECDGMYDLVVSNPPYYDSSLTNPDSRKTTARHMPAADEESSGMSYRSLVEWSKDHLNPGGSLAMILPSDQEAAILRYGRSYGFFPRKIIRVHTTTTKPSCRIILELVKERVEPSAMELSLMEKGRYTEQYTDLVKDFYLWAASPSSDLGC